MVASKDKSIIIPDYFNIYNEDYEFMLDYESDADESDQLINDDNV